MTNELLRKRFTAESINLLWLHAMRGQGRIGLPCPSCRQPMIDVALSDQAKINVDVCQHCHIVWFDAHEVETLVPRQPMRISRSLRWQHSSVTWRISLLILARRHHASAPAAALLASLHFTH